MVVNEKKTGLLCTSGAYFFTPKAHLLDEVGRVNVESTANLKLLGFVFDADGTVRSHINLVCSRLRARTWAINKLKRCGLSNEELLLVYKSAIRPVAEYVAVVWHPMMTEDQSNELEKQQIHALKNIYGCDISANKLRKKAAVETLKQRREAACLKFAKKAFENPRFRSWFPLRSETQYGRRKDVTYNKLLEYQCHTERCYNSPLFYYRRILNKSGL